MSECEKNESLLIWRHKYLAKRILNCPYDGRYLPVEEYLHDGGLGSFLALRGGMSSYEQYGVHYLTPAPDLCSMRQAFEVGEITWSEYWLSRTTLICWEFSIYDKSYVSTKYVRVTELSDMARFLISLHEHDCPLERKHRLMLKDIEHDVLLHRDPSESESAYRAFLPVYERRMKKRAA